MQISESISEVHKVPVAFSGGVDSSLLARISDHHLKKQETLVTVGFSGSHDIIFSKRISSKMGIEHKVYEIDRGDFEEKLLAVQEIIKYVNTSHIKNCIAYFYICKLAKHTS